MECYTAEEYTIAHLLANHLSEYEFEISKQAEFCEQLLEEKIDIESTAQPICKFHTDMFYLVEDKNKFLQFLKLVEEEYKTFRQENKYSCNHFRSFYKSRMELLQKSGIKTVWLKTVSKRFHSHDIAMALYISQASIEEKERLQKILNQ